MILHNGTLCRHVQYVNTFTISVSCKAKHLPSLPYHDPRKKGSFPVNFQIAQFAMTAAVHCKPQAALCSSISPSLLNNHTHWPRWACLSPFVLLSYHWEHSSWERRRVDWGGAWACLLCCNTTSMSSVFGHGPVFVYHRPSLVLLKARGAQDGGGIKNGRKEQQRRQREKHKNKKNKKKWVCKKMLAFHKRPVAPLSRASITPDFLRSNPRKFRTFSSLCGVELRPRQIKLFLFSCFSWETAQGEWNRA